MSPRSGRFDSIRNVLTERRTELILATATVALFSFYYLVRADIHGIFARGEWHAVTNPPFSTTIHYLGAGLLLGVIPLVIVVGLGRVRPSELGLGLGNWKAGLLLLAVGIPVVLVAARIGADSPIMRTIYPLDPTVTAERFIPFAVVQFAYYGAWEVLFRGIVMFGLRSRIGDSGANFLQTALSVLAHFGRPLTETLSAGPAGIFFGWIGLRLGSIWYVAFLHWLLGVAVDWFIIAG